MARFDIEIPNKVHYSTEIEIRKNDVTEGVHVAFDTTWNLIREAHHRFLNHFHFSLTEIGGTNLVFTNGAIVYLSEVSAGEVLTYDICIDHFTEKSCEYFFKVSKKDGPLACKVRITILFFDYQTKKATPVPEEFKKLFI